MDSRIQVLLEEDGSGRTEQSWIDAEEWCVANLHRGRQGFLRSSKSRRAMQHRPANMVQIHCCITAVCLLLLLLRLRLRIF